MSSTHLKLSFSSSLALVLTTVFAFSALADEPSLTDVHQVRVEKKKDVFKNPLTGTKTTTTTRKRKKVHHHGNQQPGHHAHSVISEDTQKTTKQEDRNGRLLNKTNKLEHDVKHN